MRQRLIKAPSCHPSPKMARKDKVYHQGSPCRPLSQPNEALNTTQDSHINAFKKVIDANNIVVVGPKICKVFTQRKRLHHASGLGKCLLTLGVFVKASTTTFTPTLAGARIQPLPMPRICLGIYQAFGA